MTDIGTLSIGVEVDLAGLNRQLDQAKRAVASGVPSPPAVDVDTAPAQRSLTGVNRTVVGVGQTLAGLSLGTRLIGEIRGAGDTARTFQDQVSGAASATGIAYDELAAKAQSFQFIPPSVAAEGLKSLSLVGDAMGMAGGESFALSGSLLDVAQSMSVVAGEDVTSIIEGITAATRGEYDSIQKLVPTINGAAVETRALADTGKALASELTAAETSQAALNIILDDGARYQQQLAANTGSAAAKQREAAADAERASISFGENLLPVMAKVSEVTSFLSGVFGALPGPVQLVIVGLAGLAIAGATIAPIFTAVAASSTAAGVGIGTMMAPLLPIVAAIAAVIVVGALLVTHWDTLKNVAGDVFGFIGDIVDGTIGWVGDRLGDAKDFFTAVPEWLGSAFDRVEAIITAPFRAAFAAVEAIWNSTVGGFGFTIPNWVPGGIGGREFRIPEMAEGGTVRADGWATVGERGPETLWLGQGATVTPLDQAAAGAGVGPTVNVYTNALLGTRDDVVRMVEQGLARKNYRAGR